jgi:hypothetical protein
MGSSQETQSKNKTDPWAPQAAALTDAFQKAQSAYGQSRRRRRLPQISRRSSRPTSSTSSSR